ncbi:MAG: 50S ribosomal protein L19 [Bacilli bacterium]
MNVIDKLQKEQLNPNIPEFRVGDTVRVNVHIKEGNKERIQGFEGLVLKRQGSQAGETFTVRKKSFGVGVERTFPVHSPIIESIEVIRKGKARRAKLNYVRNVVGNFKLKERK